MKKFLLSALCAVAALAGFAAEFTYSHTFAKGELKQTATEVQLSGLTWKVDAIQQFQGGDASKGYQIGSKNNPVQAWNMSTTAFQNATITSIAVKAAAASGCTATLSATVGGTAFGSSDQSYGSDLSVITLDGSASGALTIALNNGTDGKAMYIHTVTIKYTADAEIGGGAAPVDPVDPAETVGKGTAESPYTVADVVALNNPGSEAWVKGYIVGCYNYVGESGSGTNVFSATELTTVSNIAIAATPSDYGTNYIAIQLPKGDIRTALNLVDNPGNLGKEVAVKGTLSAYISDQGVKTATEYSLDGQTPVDPVEPQVPTEGAGSKDQPYTVAEAIALNNNASLGWVSGYIVGVMNYNSTDKKNDFSSTELTTNSNLVIAATPTETDLTKMMAIQLPSGSKVRSDLNLVDRPGNLGKEVSVCGSFVSYCGTNGVKETSDYTIIGGLAPVEIGEVESLTAFVEDQPATNVKIAGAVTVFYQSPDKKYTFITDGTSNIEVYGALANEYKNGDVLTGIIGKFGTYNNMPQLEPQADSFGTATAGTAIEPKTTALNAVNPADYVLLSNVNIVADGTKFNVTDGTTTRQLFNRFNIEGIEATEGATILGIGSVYGENKQIFPIAINPAQTGISEINAGNGAAAVIYDLQGRRLSAPVKGINIINGRKVLVK